MTHEELRDRLLDLAYGELSPGEAREVEAHAASCEACRAELTAIRGTRQVMSALPVEPAPERGERILVAAAREEVRTREPRRAWPRWLWAAPVVAASLVVVVAVSLRVDAPPPPSAVHEDLNALRGESFLQAPESPSPVVSAPAEPRETADAAGVAKGAPAAREAAPRLAQKKAELERRDRSNLGRSDSPPEEAPAEDRAAERSASAPAAPPPAAAPPSLGAAPAPRPSRAAPAQPDAGAAPQAGAVGAIASAAPSPGVAGRGPGLEDSEAEAKRAEEAPRPATRAKALAQARPESTGGEGGAAAGADAGAGGPLRRAITPRDRALAAARARAGAIGYSMAGTTVEVGAAPVTWDAWRAQHAPGSDAATPAALGGRRFWPVVFLPARPARGGDLTVFVEDGTFRVLAEVRGK